jgi:uncharacterized protein with NAD-binding domain and iron-sulfur cluster
LDGAWEVRIEEHGFHVWFGFYENAFRLMRECYAELNREPGKCRIADWRDAFFPAPFIGIADHLQDGSYWSFVSCFPPGDGLPGDPFTEHDPFSITSYLARAAGAVQAMLLAVHAKRSNRSSQDNTKRGAPSAGPGAAPNDTSADMAERIARLLKFGALAATAGLIEAAGLLEMFFASRSASPLQGVVGLLEMMASSARRQLEALVGDDPDLTILWQSTDLVLTAMLGILRFGLISDPKGFDAINDYEFREWMRINGASERTLGSALVRGSYDLAFAYEDGDYARPRHGAGVALRGSLRMLFGYRGAIVWKMRAGMGDVVFAPLYEVLKKRGVSFKFYHRLQRVRLNDPAQLSSGERPHVEALEFDVQADIVGDNEYQPLIDIRGLPCWPSKPDYSQLVEGNRFECEDWKFESHWDQRKIGTKTIRVMEDFDLVVLGIGIGAIPYVCEDFIQRDQRWRDMVANVKTAATQAFQIWMRDGLETVGWNGPPVSLSGFVQPFESFSDMRHLGKEEKWPTNPAAIVYFCSTLPDSSLPIDSRDASYPAKCSEVVRRNAIRFLNNDIRKLWPKAVRNPGEFNWNLLMDPGQLLPVCESERASESRFDSQFCLANVDPTERYTLSLPGTQKYRISPLDNTYDNLKIAGDWTACGLDTGCVEAAVISGRLAAHAISGSPALESIVGNDHP